MSTKRRRLLMVQVILGDGSGGACPYCESTNTRHTGDTSCEICGEMVDECYCYNCHSSYTNYNCENPDCGESNTGCPKCSNTGDMVVIDCPNCGLSEIDFCESCGYEGQCSNCGYPDVWCDHTTGWYDTCPWCGKETLYNCDDCKKTFCENPDCEYVAACNHPDGYVWYDICPDCFEQTMLTCDLCGESYCENPDCGA